MNRVLIIGGGIAGLTAASILSSKKNPVTLFEASPKLGGRTYSFFDSDVKTSIDNGQHILMGCYKDTLKFIKLIKAENNFNYQKNLKLDFITKDNSEFKIDTSKGVYPFNLLYALFNYGAFSSKDKIAFLKLVLKLPIISKKILTKFTVSEWLAMEDQTESSVKNFWEILCVGAMNTSIQKASALIFHNILMQIFFNGNSSSTIILPKYGLSESIVDPAVEFIISNGGFIRSSEAIKAIVVNNNKAVIVKTDTQTLEDFDYVISAIPNYSLQKVLDTSEVNFENSFEYSTIVNIHLWTNKLNLKEKFYGFLHSPLHWIFIKDQHINIVISDANYLTDKSREDIFELVSNELSEIFSIKQSDITNYKIIKEKRATFIPSINVLDIRPNCETNIKNLFLAGDWTNTGLPSTIESAAKSGRIAAELVLNRIS